MGEGDAKGASEASAGDKVESNPERSATQGLLRKTFLAAGAQAGEADAWSAAVEATLWAQVAAVDYNPIGNREDDQDYVLLFRRYRSEVRRISSAFKDKASAAELIPRLRSGDLDAAVLPTLAPEELMSEAKRKQLRKLRPQTSEETLGRKQSFVDADMVCAECGKAGHVTWGRMAGPSEGYGNPDSWGARDNENQGDRCQAHCTACLAEWIFDR